MKELNLYLPQTDLIQIEKQLLKREKKVASKMLKRGQKLFGLKNGQLNEIPDSAYEEVSIEHRKGIPDGLRKKLKIDPETFYIVALNRDNAMRKLRNYIRTKK